MTIRRKRADVVLVELGLAPTRSKAQQLIEDGRLKYEGQVVKKASLKIGSDNIEVKVAEEFVGRGALKLKGAFEAHDIIVEDKIAADVGASTGGFTQYLLKMGARKVYAIDVGHGQLAQELLSDKRVINLEKTNIRHGIELDEHADFVCVDLSFISLKLVLAPIFKLAASKAVLVFLFKPQFEVGKSNLNKQGVAKSPEAIKQSLQQIQNEIENLGHEVIKIIPSPITGQKGNQESLIITLKT